MEKLSLWLVGEAANPCCQDVPEALRRGGHVAAHLPRGALGGGPPEDLPAPRMGRT